MNREILSVPDFRPERKAFGLTTGTFYPRYGQEGTADDVQGNLALETLKSAQRESFRIFVIDGGSSRAFLEKAAALGVDLKTQTKPGMSAGRMEGFETASRQEGVEVIIWIEPEKASLIPNIYEAGKLIGEGQADIVVPSRDEQAFASYPEYQAEIEKRANKIFNSILRKSGLLKPEDPDLDAWFGVRLFKNDPEIVRLFTTAYAFEPRKLDLDKIVKPELWSNAIFLPLIAALHKGYRVKSFPVHYQHPAQQTALETGSVEFDRKRRIQLRNIITSAIHMVRELIGDPKKPSRLRKESNQ